MAKNFQLYSKYYDLIYADKDYAAEVDYVNRLIQKYNPGSKKLLEFGSGTGYHGELLAGIGYKVIGIEKSPDMVEVANLKVSQDNFASFVGDIAEMQLNETFDGVVALFHVISYQTSNDQLISVFNNAHRHLDDGGIFLFDVWYTPAVYTQKPETRVKRLKDDSIELVRIAEPVIHSDNNVVEVNYHMIIKDRETGEISEFHEVHPMRHFSIPEISILARYTGFEVLKAEEFLTGKIPAYDTWGVCFVLKKFDA